MGWFGKLSEKGPKLLGPPAVAVLLSGCGLFQQKPNPKQNEFFGGKEVVLQLWEGIEPGKYELSMEVVDWEWVVKQIKLWYITKQRNSQEEIKFPTAPLLRSYNQLENLWGITELRLYSLDGKGSNYTVLIQGEREKQLDRVKIDVVTNQVRMLLVEALSIVEQTGSEQDLQQLISKILEIIEFNDLDRDRKHDADDFVEYLKNTGVSTEVLEWELWDEIAGYVQAYMRGEISEESLRRLLWDILYPYFVQQDPDDGDEGEELPPDDEDNDWQIPEWPSWEDIANDIINELSNLRPEIADEVYHLTPEQREQLEARLQELNEQLQQLQSTIEQLQAQLQQLGDKIEANQDSWDAARERLQELLTKKASLEEQMWLLAEILKKEQITQQDIENLLAASASGQSQSTSWALATTLRVATTLGNGEVDLEQLDQELVKELRNINRVIDLLQQKLEEIRSELGQINRQISNTIDQINSTQREIDRLEGQKQQLEDEISQMRADYNRLMQLKPIIDPIIDLYLQYKEAKAEADRANQERISALDKLQGHIIDPMDMSWYSYYTSKTTTYNGHTITWTQYVTYVNGRASYPVAICAESLWESVGTCLRIRNADEKQPWWDYYETYVDKWTAWKLAVRERNNKYTAFNSQAQAHRAELEETRGILGKYWLTYYDIDQIPDKIRALERQKQQLEDEIAALRNRLDDLNAQLRRLNDQKADLERQKQQVQDELDRAQQRKREIEQQLGIYQPVVEEAQAQIPPLKDEEQTKQDYENTNQQLDQAQQDYERLEQERQRIEEALRGASDELKPYDLMFVDENWQEYREVDSLPINPSFLVPWGYGSQEYVKTPFTIYVQYGINNDGTNYPAKVWLEYVDGDTVKQTNVYEVNNYGQKETVKWELIDMYSQMLEQLYQGEYEYRWYKYWLRKTEDGRWWGYYEIGGVKKEISTHDSRSEIEEIIRGIIDLYLLQLEKSILREETINEWNKVYLDINPLKILWYIENKINEVLEKVPGGVDTVTTCFMGLRQGASIGGMVCGMKYMWSVLGESRGKLKLTIDRYDLNEVMEPIEVDIGNKNPEKFMEWFERGNLDGVKDATVSIGKDIWELNKLVATEVSAVWLRVYIWIQRLRGEDTSLAEEAWRYAVKDLLEYGDAYLEGLEEIADFIANIHYLIPVLAEVADDPQQIWYLVWYINGTVTSEAVKKALSRGTLWAKSTLQRIGKKLEIIKNYLRRLWAKALLKMNLNSVKALEKIGVKKVYVKELWEEIDLDRLKKVIGIAKFMDKEFVIIEKYKLYDNFRRKALVLEDWVLRRREISRGINVKVDEKAIFEAQWHIIFGNWDILSNWKLVLKWWLHSYHSLDEVFKKGKIRVAVRKEVGEGFKEISYEERRELGDINEYKFRITSDLETTEPPKRWWDIKTLFPSDWSNEEIIEWYLQAQKEIKHILHDVYRLDKSVDEELWWKNWKEVLGREIEHTIRVNWKTLKVKLGGKYDNNGYIQYEIRTFYP